MRPRGRKAGLFDVDALLRDGDDLVRHVALRGWSAIPDHLARLAAIADDRRRPEHSFLMHANLEGSFGPDVVVEPRGSHHAVDWKAFAGRITPTLVTRVSRSLDLTALQSAYEIMVRRLDVSACRTCRSYEARIFGEYLVDHRWRVLHHWEPLTRPGCRRCLYLFAQYVTLTAIEAQLQGKQVADAKAVARSGTRRPHAPTRLVLAALYARPDIARQPNFETDSPALLTFLREHQEVGPFRGIDASAIQGDPLSGRPTGELSFLDESSRRCTKAWSAIEAALDRILSAWPQDIVANACAAAPEIERARSLEDAEGQLIAFLRDNHELGRFRQIDVSAVELSSSEPFEGARVTFVDSTGTQTSYWIAFRAALRAATTGGDPELVH